MDEIKVGEYVRDKDGCIIKVDEIQDYESEQDIWYKAETTIGGTWKSMVAKHSPDITDLICYGDFINGKMCIGIERYTRDDGTKGINFICLGGSVLKEDIKDIVTHEQFNRAKYELI